ncbi:TlpA family protein disulfide reductase [Thermosulfidibacter takaii]|nr:hypothetical protein [Thermosulfidibacter takaii]
MAVRFTRNIESMRRRYDRCSWDRRSPRVSWFIIFFLLIAIFFFNYFGKKLGGERFAKMPLDIVVVDRYGKKLLLAPFDKDFAVLVFVTTGCRPCQRQIEEAGKLSLDWVATVAVYLDGKIKEDLGLERVFAVDPKEINRVVELFGIKRVPLTLIVDKRGLIRRRIEGFVDKSTLESYLKAIKRYGI